MKKWYAVKMVREMRRNGDTEAYIAVIDESGNEPMCIDEIHDVRGL